MCSLSHCLHIPLVSGSAKPSTKKKMCWEEGEPQLSQAFLDRRVFLKDGTSFEELPIRLHFVDYSEAATKRDEQACMETE